MFFFSLKLLDKGEPRTFGSLKAQLEEWTQAGGVKAAAKDYGNVVNMSLVSADVDVPVIDILPPPELHLLLGAVNTLYSGLYISISVISPFTRCAQLTRLNGYTFFF